MAPVSSVGPSSGCARYPVSIWAMVDPAPGLPGRSFPAFASASRILSAAGTPRCSRTHSVLQEGSSRTALEFGLKAPSTSITRQPRSSSVRTGQVPLSAAPATVADKTTMRNGSPRILQPSSLSSPLAALQDRARGPQLLPLRLVHLGEAEVQVLEGVDDRGRYRQAGEPLVVGGDDVPGGVGGGRAPDHVLVGVHVGVPVLALPGVLGRELPVFLRLLEAAQEALLLLLARHVEEELPDHDPVVVEVLLEMVDVLEKVLADALGEAGRRQLLAGQELRVDADHQHFLVVGAVEDADPPPLGETLEAPP